MSRLLAFAVLLALVWMVLQRLRAVLLSSPRGQELRAVWRLLRQAGAASGGGSRPASTATSQGAGGGGAVARPITLVRCTVCGTHVPEGTALRGATGVFCSEACELRRAP